MAGINGWPNRFCREYVSLYALPIAMVRPFFLFMAPVFVSKLFWDTYQKYLANPDHIELWGTGREKPISFFYR